MPTDTISQETTPAPSPEIVRCSLVRHMRRGRYCYSWRHPRSKAAGWEAALLLVDMNGILMPEEELDRLVGRFAAGDGPNRAVAFLNCPLVNQRQLKLKLKQHDVHLYSQTAFCADVRSAERWLAGRAVSRQ